MKIVKVLSFVFLSCLSVVSINAMNPNNEKLIEAARKGNIESAEAALQGKANINVTLQGVSPLLAAAAMGRTDMVKFLLSHGASIDFYPQAFNGMTPLHNAAARGYLPIVKLLIQQGANTQARDSDGKTPLDLAKTFKKWKIVDFLEGQNKMEDEDLGMHRLNLKGK